MSILAGRPTQEKDPAVDGRRGYKKHPNATPEPSSFLEKLV